jgi:bacteriocin-like protein
MKRNTTNNINRRETEAEMADLAHVLTDEELARVVGGADRDRVDHQSFVIMKLSDKASP